MKNPILGILGGLGPASSVYFYDLITSHTKAGCDSDHIDLVLSSHATTPDRTDYIVGRSRENPVTCMAQDARKLEAFGADFIAIPCNTAHTFYEELAEAVSVPVINIMAETVGFLHFLGVRKVGVLLQTALCKAALIRRCAAGSASNASSPRRTASGR